jgi:hypothetical protein
MGAALVVTPRGELGKSGAARVMVVYTHDPMKTAIFRSSESRVLAFNFEVFMLLPILTPLHKLIAELRKLAQPPDYCEL